MICVQSNKNHTFSDRSIIIKEKNIIMVTNDFIITTDCMFNIKDFTLKCPTQCVDLSTTDKDKDKLYINISKIQWAKETIENSSIFPNRNNNIFTIKFKKLPDTYTIKPNIYSKIIKYICTNK